MVILSALYNDDRKAIFVVSHLIEVRDTLHNQLLADEPICVELTA